MIIVKISCSLVTLNGRRKSFRVLGCFCYLTLDLQNWYNMTLVLGSVTQSIVDFQYEQQIYIIIEYSFCSSLRHCQAELFWTYLLNNSVQYISNNMLQIACEVKIVFPELWSLNNIWQWGRASKIPEDQYLRHRLQQNEC